VSCVVESAAVPNPDVDTGKATYGLGVLCAHGSLVTSRVQVYLEGRFFCFAPSLGPSSNRTSKYTLAPNPRGQGFSISLLLLLLLEDSLESRPVSSGAGLFTFHFPQGPSNNTQERKRLKSDLRKVAFQRLLLSRLKSGFGLKFIFCCLKSDFFPTSGYSLFSDFPLGRKKTALKRLTTSRFKAAFDYPDLIKAAFN